MYILYFFSHKRLYIYIYIYIYIKWRETGAVRFTKAVWSCLLTADTGQTGIGGVPVYLCFHQGGRNVGFNRGREEREMQT